MINTGQSGGQSSSIFAQIGHPSAPDCSIASLMASVSEQIRRRDRRLCCAPAPLVAHHRRPSNRPSALITLCRACHARLHRLRAIDRWVPAVLEELWAEQHPGSPRQLQLLPTR